jgi:hypothetical protein
MPRARREEMADGRMLKRKISIDRRWADLANDTYRLLFTVGLAHLDVEGRITGDPREFKATVAPMLEHITAEMVEGFFVDACQLGLIHRYCVGEQSVVAYPSFKKNQNLRPDREGPSRFPSPPDTPGLLPDKSRSNPGELPNNSGPTPAEVKISEVKISKEKGREDKNTLSSDSKCSTVTQTGDGRQKTKKMPKTFPEDSDAYRLAELLLQKILERKPNFKRPNLQTWAGSADRILRVDGRSAKSIENVIAWCQKDDFWQNNILSPEKLRKQFDQLELKMEAEIGVAPYRKPNGGSPPPENETLRKIREARAKVEKEKAEMAEEERKKGDDEWRSLSREMGEEHEADLSSAVKESLERKAASQEIKSESDSEGG